MRHWLTGPTNGHPHCRSTTAGEGDKGRRSEKESMKSRIARLEKQQSVADRFRRPLDLQAKRVKAELKETAQVLCSIQGTSRIFLGLHREERRKITNICALPLLLFLVEYLALAGLMNFLSQVSGRNQHFTVYNLMPLAFLTKLSNMHLV